MTLQAQQPATAYHFIEDVEDASKYRVGGFHPVSIGDKLNKDQYQVVHKLGYGGYSTIWLALDLVHHRYVAVKICSAESRVSSTESEILQRLSQLEGDCLVPRLLDTFNVDGPNGRHECFVMPPAMMSIRDSKEASHLRLFRPEVANRIVSQLVAAVDFLHSKGIVHADIHPGNIFFRLPRTINSLTPAEIYQRYGEPEFESVRRVDGNALEIGVPSQLVVPAWLGKASEDIEEAEAEVLLSDFGESFLASSTSRYHSNSPLSFRPPEANFLLAPLGMSADIWSLACVIWEVLGQRPLFESWMATTDEVLADQVELLGKLPPEWWARWAARSQFYSEDKTSGVIEATRERPEGVERWGWGERLELCVQRPRREAGLPQMGDDERAVLLELLQSMIRFDPEARITARELRGSRWMQMLGM